MKSLRDAAASALHLLRPESADLPPHDAERLREEMAACLGARSEVARRGRVAALGARYATLSALGRLHFLALIASFEADHAAVDAAAARLGETRSNAERSAAERALRELLLPSRVTLLRAFNSLPDGVKFLVDLRAELLALAEPDAALHALDADLKELLAAWFDIGFLHMRRITWDAPAAFLEKLAGYEAVHEIRGWSDLKNRLDDDRRCFAFVHPAMPDEPLIFIEVALTNAMPSAMRPLLDPHAPEGDLANPSHAIFYSISNCQAGLAGISFGNALIKRVVTELSGEFRSLRTFATLSPVPRFRDWLERAEAASGTDDEQLHALLARRSWYRDASLATSLRDPLLRLCAHFLLEAKRPSGRVEDPVAHFHLSNGARLERVNWLADTSSKGMRESAGMMANYLYAPERIDANQEHYATEFRIDASPAVLALADRRGWLPRL